MKYFKKYPFFYILMFLLLAAFVGGVSYNLVLLADKKAADRQLSKSMRDYKEALDADPTQKAIADSEANIKSLNTHLDILEKELTRAEVFKKQNATEGYQLVEELRGMVHEWRKKARNLDIDVPADMDFSLKKYVAPGADPMPKEAVAPVWKQVCVLDYIIGKLYAAKSEKSPMGIVNIQREILKEEVDKSKAKKPTRAVSRRTANRKQSSSQAMKGDNFVIDPAVTARKEGSLRTIAFRFIFTGHTDVLRRFLNELRTFDAMLVVRSIDVRPADKSNVAGGGGGGGGQFVMPTADGAGLPAQNANMAFTMPTDDQLNAMQPSAEVPADGTVPVEGGEVTSENRTPVVTDNISEFSVVIEYVEVVKDSPKAKAEAGNGDEKK